MALLSKIFVGRSLQHWLDALKRAGVPAGPIYKMDEVFADQQVLHLGMATPMSMEDGRQIRVVATPINMSRTPPMVRTVLPRQGADTETILAEIGVTSSEIAELRNAKVI